MYFADSSIESKYKIDGCFPGNANIRVLGKTNQTIKIADLQVGDRVLSINDVTGKLQNDVILTFLHRNPTAKVRITVITTVNGTRLTLTPHHLILSTTSNTGTDKRYVFADQLTIDCFIFVKDSSGELLRIEKVALVTSEIVNKGVYAPLTRSGTILIDDVAVSCYALVKSHYLAHAVLAPVRLFHELFSYTEFEAVHFKRDYVTETSLHWYADVLHAVGRFILPSNYFYVV